MERKSEKGGIHVGVRGLVSDSAGKDSACNAGSQGSMPGSDRSPGGGNGYHCSVENSMDRGTWWIRVHGVTKSPRDWVTSS